MLEFSLQTSGVEWPIASNSYPSEKFASQFIDELTLNVIEGLEPLQSPDQFKNLLPGFGVAIKLTVSLGQIEVSQFVPQFISPVAFWTEPSPVIFILNFSPLLSLFKNKNERKPTPLPPRGRRGVGC